MSVQMSINAVIDGRQIHLQKMSSAHLSVQVVNSPQLHQACSVIVIQGSACVWMCRRGDVNPNVGGP